MKHIYLSGGLYDKSEWNSSSAFSLALSNLGQEVLFIPYNFTVLRGFKNKYEKYELLSYLYGKRQLKINNNLKIILLPPLFHFGLKEGSLFKIKLYFYLKEFNRFIKNLRKIISIEKEYYNANIWTSSPLAHVVKKNFPNNKVIYHTVDDMRKLSSTNFNFFERNERLCAQNCNYVLTVSEYLTKRFHSIGANVIQSSIGLNRVDTNTIHPLNEIRNIGNSLMGFIGKMANFIDFELIYKILNVFNDSKLIIVGPKNHNYKYLPVFLRNNKNVILFDSYPESELPNVAESFDICLLPFKINEVTKASDPMKMFDYIRSSKPIVAMYVNSNMERYRNYVSLCNNQKDFIDNIRKILEDKLYFNDRSSFIKEYTWESIVMKVLNQL